MSVMSTLANLLSASLRKEKWALRTSELAEMFSLRNIFASSIWTTKRSNSVNQSDDPALAWVHTLPFPVSCSELSVLITCRPQLKAEKAVGADVGHLGSRNNASQSPDRFSFQSDGLDIEPLSKLGQPGIKICVCWISCSGAFEPGQAYGDRGLSASGNTTARDGSLLLLSVLRWLRWQQQESFGKPETSVKVKSSHCLVFRSFADKIARLWQRTSAADADSQGMRLMPR